MAKPQVGESMIGSIPPLYLGVCYFEMKTNVEAFLLHIKTIFACGTQHILQAVTIFQMLTAALSKFHWSQRVDMDS